MQRIEWLQQAVAGASGIGAALSWGRVPSVHDKVDSTTEIKVIARFLASHGGVKRVYCMRSGDALDVSSQ
jgi:hypothetical protein